ncbi:MAG TPA: 4Fe-4S binding protein [Oscillospiraceae bacterium]|nr:4Fe-4S binding protein [Oscillospiraceae bacterium]
MKYIANIIRILFLALFIFLLANGKVALWLALFGASLVVALIFGRIYCGYVCPMNTLMILIEWLSKKLKLQTPNTPKWLKSGYLTWITLLISIVMMLLFQRLLHIDLPILPFWLVVSILITLRYKPEVFHNLICPFGALQRTLGRFSRLSEKVDKDACIGCKLCEKVCPSNAILVSSEDKKAMIKTALCHQCTNCQQVCPKSAIHYGKHKA